MFVRFGKVPEGGRSLNWKALSFRDNEDITFALKMGDSLEDAVWMQFDFAGRTPEQEIWEKGVSAFRADENGLPVIENIDQMRSLWKRIGDEIFLIDADEIGIGQDGEPLLANIREIKQIEIPEETLRAMVKEEELR